jgi:hypothetical protein
MLAGLGRSSQGLDAVQRHTRIVEKSGVNAHCVRSSGHARHDMIGQSPVIHRHELLPGLLPDNRLKVANDQRKRMRADCGAYRIEGMSILPHIGVVRGIACFLEGRLTLPDGNHRCPENLHAADVGTGFLKIDFSDVHLAFKAEMGGGRGKRDPVLACTRFRDQPSLAHVPCEQSETDAVIELVGAGVVQVLALDEKRRAADLSGKIGKAMYRCGPTLEMRTGIMQLALEIRCVPGTVVCFGQSSKRGPQLPRVVDATISAVVAFAIRVAVEIGARRF